MSYLLIAIEVTALTIFFYMALWFLLSLREKRNDIVDIAWGLGFIVVAITNLFIFESNILNIRAILAAVLVTVWGLRLSIYLKLRMQGNKEDKRYGFVKTRKDAFFKVFMLQGFLMLMICLMLIVLINTPNQRPLNLLDFFGVLVWCAGFYFEATADYQMYKFKADPKNKSKILTEGLWSLSRHPNYFGEITQWWGIFLIALNLPFIYLSIISPITITYLILMVSGIPMLESKLSKTKPYKEYLSRTPILIPRIKSH